MEFSDRLKQLRAHRDLTQEELADQVGVGKQAISQYERGVRRPDFDTLTKLCDFFNVSTDYILGNSNVTIRFVDSDDLEKLNNTTAYYHDPETARLAQEMYDDPEMRALFHMKRNMEPEKFQAHYDMMRKLYEMEHPEESDDFYGC